MVLQDRRKIKYSNVLGAIQIFYVYRKKGPIREFEYLSKYMEGFFASQANACVQEGPELFHHVHHILIIHHPKDQNPIVLAFQQF